MVSEKSDEYHDNVLQERMLISRVCDKFIQHTEALDEWRSLSDFEYLIIQAILQSYTFDYLAKEAHERIICLLILVVKYQSIFMGNFNFQRYNENYYVSYFHLFCINEIVNQSQCKNNKNR